MRRSAAETQTRSFVAQLDPLSASRKGSVDQTPSLLKLRQVYATTFEGSCCFDYLPIKGLNKKAERVISVTMFGLGRSMATAASQASLSLKQAGKVVCIGRNYA